MPVFQYPKERHARRLKPPALKRYGSYKRYLQHEFNRLCVYCRQPDTSAPLMVYQVDHYRPKSLPTFADLVTDYSNLYYCCGGCNCRKGNYWPQDEQRDPWVVNPCEHYMAAHLRFETPSCKVAPRTEFGRWTEELLALNAHERVQYRQTTLRTLQLIERELLNLRQDANALAAKLKSGQVTQAQHDAAMAHIAADQANCRLDAQLHSGELPARALPGRGGKTLHQEA